MIERGDRMRKKAVMTVILILLLIAVGLGMIRYWMTEQRQSVQEQGTLVKISEEFQKEKQI